ncbi:MAG: AI-2E family transporter [Planctomycetes bacterium]|nr:AI-2E family transporter [Planctomycetota bacterium]
MAPQETTERTLPPPWDRIFGLATRTFVWGLLIGVLYLLRPFLLLVFLTFVFAYIQAHGVDGLQQRIKNRPLRVVIVGLVVLGTLLATGFTLVPQIQEQAKTFLQNKDKYLVEADAEVDKFLRQYPSLYDGLKKHQSTTFDPSEFTKPTPSGGDTPTGQDPTPPTKPAPTPEPAPAKLTLVRDFIGTLTESLAKNPLGLVQSGLGYASSFLLSLLFSFLIVLDLKKLQRGVQGLSRTKVGFIYDEVADNIAGFGRVLGRALEAQLAIALVNTILTALGIWLMDLDNILVLSAIVFFCSFIPVAGTFISTTPIALVALQSDGVSALVLVIVLICVIHAIETYVLNPQIYGHHMHMNPVLVLIVLTIGGQLFGVWGLLLGIPVVNYVFRHAIRRPEERPEEA